MNRKSQLLVRLLDSRYGLAITEDVAREDISNHVGLVAITMRIGRQAAKYYVTDDVIAGLAAHIATAIAAHNVVDRDRHRLQRTLQPPATSLNLRTRPKSFWCRVRARHRWHGGLPGGLADRIPMFSVPGPHPDWS